MSNSPLHFTSSFRVDEDLPQSPINPPNPDSSSNPSSHPLQRYQTLLQKTTNLSLLVAYLKIFASMCVLLIAPTSCNQPLSLWLSMMMFYDFMVIIGNLLKTQIKDAGLPHANQGSESSEEQGFVLHPVINPRPVEQTDEEDSLLRGQSNLDGLQGSSQWLQAYNYLLNLIQKYSPWYYAFLFFFGNSIVFDLDSDCPMKAPLLDKLATTFVVLQYITISLPIVFCFSVLCICCSTICFSVVGIYKAHRQAVSNHNIIEELPNHKYPINLKGDHECSICMCAYEDGAEVVQLDCSKMHHFHSECIKKWLKVNGICPICRTKLEDMKKNNASEADYENPKER